MISIIVCSINTILLTQIKENIENTIGVKYEIISIDNKINNFSLAHAYNWGAKRAQYPYLCFIHEDILFHTENWGQKLINHFNSGNISLIGMLGSIIKTKTPSGVYMPIQSLNRIYQSQRRTDGNRDIYFNNPNSDIRSSVRILDGMFLATTKSNYEKYQFDESISPGFHGYDIDFSLGQQQNGKVIVIYDILLEHMSYGGNTVAWIDAQLNITRKWAFKLPSVDKVNNIESKKAEIINNEILLIAMFNNNYKKSIQLKYLISLFRLRLFSWKNFYFLRRFLVFGKMEMALKEFKQKIG